MTRLATGVVLKSPLEVERMRAAGGVVSAVLTDLGRRVRPGVTTGQLDARAKQLILAAGAEPLFTGVTHRQSRRPFPGCVCVSVNHEVVHGVPGDRRLCDGDIVSIDCGVRLNGVCADAARTYPVGRIRLAAAELIAAAEAALAAGLRAMRPRGRWRDAAAAMQATVEAGGFGFVRDYAGHGIGRELHEPPTAFGHASGRPEADFDLTPGLTLAVEPMVTAGDGAVRLADAEGWTVVTCNGGWAAHVEDTVAVTATGIEILTGGPRAAGLSA